MLTYSLALAALALGGVIVYIAINNQTNNPQRPIIQPSSQSQGVKDFPRKTFHIGCFLVDRVNNHYGTIKSDLQFTEYQYQNSLRQTMQAQAFSGYSIDFHSGNLTQYQTISEYQQNNIGLARAVEQYINAIINLEANDQQKYQYHDALQKAQNAFQKCKNNIKLNNNFDSNQCKQKWGEFQGCLSYFQATKQKIKGLMNQRKLLVDNVQQFIRNKIYASKTQDFSNKHQFNLQRIEYQQRSVQNKLHQTKKTLNNLTKQIQQTKQELQQAKMKQKDCYQHLSGSITCSQAIQKVNSVGFLISNNQYIRQKRMQKHQVMLKINKALKSLKDHVQIQKLHNIKIQQKKQFQFYLRAELLFKQVNFSCRCSDQQMQWRSSKVQQLQLRLSTKQAEFRSIRERILAYQKQIQQIKERYQRAKTEQSKSRFQDEQKERLKTQLEKFKQNQLQLDTSIENLQEQLNMSKIRCQNLERQIKIFVQDIGQISDCIQRKSYFVQLQKSQYQNALNTSPSSTTNQKSNVQKEKLKNILKQYEL